MWHDDLGCNDGNLAAAVAIVLAEDQRANGFMFSGFPSVRCERAGNAISVTLQAHKYHAGPFMMELTTAKRLADDFMEKRNLDWAVKEFQAWAAELERVALDNG